jgi:hypothetical protein
MTQTVAQKDGLRKIFNNFKKLRASSGVCGLLQATSRVWKILLEAV